MAEIPVSKSYSILNKDGSLNKKKLSDALELLKSDLEFLRAEVDKSFREESK